MALGGSKTPKLAPQYQPIWVHINPLPHMPILGSPNSAENKNMMSKIWTNGGTII